LIAQGRGQPIEQRRCVMALDGGGNAFALQSELWDRERKSILPTGSR
jgi:hypothetical protein